MKMMRCILMTKPTKQLKLYIFGPTFFDMTLKAIQLREKKLQRFYGSKKRIQLKLGEEKNDN